MKVEIWSDVVCPFCYIGKRRFEKALEAFPEKVEIEWKSFQLDPGTVSSPGVSVIEYMAGRKGISLEQSVEMHRQVTQMANEWGLDFHFERALVANTLDAHRLLHFAAVQGKQAEVKERLLSAYFIEGKNIGDRNILVSLAEETGLNPQDVRKSLEDNSFSGEVKADILEARKLGIRGVPFFMFNKKYGVSGAQAPETFLDILKKVQEEETGFKETEGNSCAVDGDC